MTRLWVRLAFRTKEGLLTSDDAWVDSDLGMTPGAIGVLEVFDNPEDCRATGYECLSADITVEESTDDDRT